jgi:serine/threonine protein kinase
MAEWVGRRIGGKYFIQERLGQGGMGTVYLARQEGLGREVAVKVVPAALVAEEQRLPRRFQREAAICARFSHRHVVKVFDLGLDEGDCYLVMELVRAASLADLLTREPIQPVAFTLKVACQIASACRAFHPLGIIHRDLKPANILLDESQDSILTDFGLAKDLQASSLTVAGQVVGTPYYMSPEMVRGVQVSCASDLWQLGAVMYEMLTGRVPFLGDSAMEVLDGILHDEAPEPSLMNAGVSPDLNNVILNCLEKDLALRYRDADELLRDLAAVLRQERVVRRRSCLPSLTPAAALGATVELPDGGPSEPLADRRRPVKRTVRRPIVRPPERSRWTSSRLTIGVLVFVMAGLAAWLSIARQPPEASGVRCETGAYSARVCWSGGPGGSVVWWEAGGAKRTAAADCVTGPDQRALLTPLVPGGEYRCRVEVPGGVRSLEHQFRAQAAPFEPLDFSVRPAGLTLSLVTELSCIASLTSGTRTTSSRVASSRHMLSLDGLDPVTAALALTVTDRATGHPLRLERDQLLAPWREKLLRPGLREFARQVEVWDPAPMLTAIDRRLPTAVCGGVGETASYLFGEGAVRRREARYYSFAPGDPLANKLATELAAQLSSQPFMRQLPMLVALGHGTLDSRLLSPELELEFLRAARALAHVDYFAGFLRIPFATGVQRFFLRDFQLSSRPILRTPSGNLTETLPEKAVWVHPLREYRFARLQGMVEADLIHRNSHEWRFELSKPQEWKTAELLLLGVRLETELLFRVTINGNLILDFRNEPAVNLDNRNELIQNSLSMAFDPRLLRGGPNSVKLELLATPGSRLLDVRFRSKLRALKLAWEL